MLYLSLRRNSRQLPFFNAFYPIVIYRVFHDALAIVDRKHTNNLFKSSGVWEWCQT